MYVLAPRAVIWFAHSFSASQSSDQCNDSRTRLDILCEACTIQNHPRKGLGGLRAPAVKKPETWRERRDSREGAAN
jgi:hypothetical protein